MQIRRFVTGRDAAGNSIFIAEGPAPRAKAFDTIPGHAFAQPWATPPLPPLPALADGPADPTLGNASLVPAPGGTSFLIVTFPPDSVMAASSFDPAAAAAELGPALPGLAEAFEPDAPGMHTTATIDYGIVLDGEIWLELDNGEQRQLHATDVVIQHGTRHAWRNKTGKPATVAFVLIGASRNQA
ncbi:cupin domain-containing protein [Cupriavidus necator]